MKGYQQLALWKGVPIYLHWTVLLGIVWLFVNGYSASQAIQCFFAYVLLMLCHEMGHAVVAKWRNIPVRSVRLYILVGVCIHDTPKHKKDDIWIAWGGVLAQCILLVFASVVDTLLAFNYPLMNWLMQPFFDVLIHANIAIIMLNLLPIKPLDGYLAWQAVPLFRRWLEKSQRQNTQHRSRTTSAQPEWGSANNGHHQLRTELLGMVGWSQEVVSRLIAAEKQRYPRATEVELIRSIIQRLKRDRR